MACGASWGQKLRACLGRAMKADTRCPLLPQKADKEPDTEDAAAIEAFRREHGFRRRTDGRVQLQSPESKAWLEVKLDGYVEGSLLMRDESSKVYYLVSEDLKQIDLSNDQLIGQLFSGGGWESLKQPLYSQDPQGEMVHVRMTPQQFRGIFTVLKEAPKPGQL